VERGPRRRGAHESHNGEAVVAPPTTTNDAGGGCPISAHIPREEAKPGGIERWSNGDHKSGLGSGRGDRRWEIWRRRRAGKRRRGSTARYGCGAAAFFISRDRRELRGNEDVRAPGRVGRPDGSIFIFFIKLWRLLRPAVVRTRKPQRHGGRGGVCSSGRSFVLLSFSPHFSPHFLLVLQRTQ
jgi:hypothetical protein